MANTQCSDCIKLQVCKYVEEAKELKEKVENFTDRRINKDVFTIDISCKYFICNEYDWIKNTGMVMKSSVVSNM